MRCPISSEPPFAAADNLRLLRLMRAFLTLPATAQESLTRTAEALGAHWAQASLDDARRR